MTVPESKVYRFFSHEYSKNSPNDFKLEHNLQQIFLHLGNHGNKKTKWRANNQKCQKNHFLFDKG